MDTGYEAKFDFPARDRAPERSYLLATVPRSGSTYLSHVLWRTGCLGAPLEYLNFEPASRADPKQRLEKARLTHESGGLAAIGNRHRLDRKPAFHGRLE